MKQRACTARFCAVQALYLFQVVITHMSEYRQVQGEIKLLQRRNEFLYDVELWMLSASANRNNWKYPVNEAVARLFLGKPLLTAYIGDGTIVGDGHNFLEYFDENGEIHGDFTAADAERIVGSLSEDPADIRVVERDGDTWIVGRGTLWEWYCGQLCEQIRGLAEQGRTMPVSIETLVSESHMDGDIEVMDEFIVLGVTILGVHVTPAVAGARITALQALESGEYQQLKLKAASYLNPKTTETEPKNNETKPDGAEAEPPENKSKGVKQALIYNKKQLETLAKRFPEYILLAASKDDETGAIKVKMRNASFDLYSYEMQSEGETVVPERFQPFFASVDLGDGVSMDANDYNDQMAAELRRMTADKTAAEDELKKTREALNKMQENEKKRRIEVSKAAVKRALENFNANRTVKVDEAAVAEVLKKAEDGDYTTCKDGEGCWTGEAAAERDCLAECAKKDIEIQAKLAKDAAQKEKNVHIWEKLNDNSAGADDGSVGALLKRLKIKE